MTLHELRYVCNNITCITKVTIIDFYNCGKTIYNGNLESALSSYGDIEVNEFIISRWNELYQAVGEAIVISYKGR